MNALLGGWRLARALLHGLRGLALVCAVFPLLRRADREARIGVWAGRMLRAFGIGLELHGRWRPGAKLVVANHVSWLDILVLHAACPEARFVSKAEVRRWPLVARLADAARTLYLERGRTRDASRVVHRIADALREGDTVAVFPEGTVGDGHALLPFHANLLQAAIAVAAVVQPVALRYADAGAPVSRAVLFTGDITFGQSLWRVARGQRLRVVVQVLPALVTAHADRRALAERLRGEIAAALDAQGAIDASGRSPTPAAVSA